MSSKKRPCTASPTFFSSEIWETGSIVWVKWVNKWWSGIILKRRNSKSRVGMKIYLVFWFGDHRISEVMCISLRYELIISAMEAKEPLLNVCLSCYSLDVDDEHPFFQGHICLKCQDNLRKGLDVIGDDALCVSNTSLYGIIKYLGNMFQYYCTVCGLTGTMLYCDNDACGKIQKLYLAESPALVSIPPPPPIKRPLRVLSLFDGIATGLLVLKSLHLEVEAYFVSEVDSTAISIASMHFMNNITYIGDVCSIAEEDIERMSPINLVLGGSPCSDLSLVNPYRKGLIDQAGTGRLFFEFYRIVQDLKRYNPQGFYWLFENVASMQKELKSDISRYLQCEPTLINSLCVSPQHRNRLYWGNLPTLKQPVSTDSIPLLQNYLMPKRMALVDCIKTVTTRNNSLKQSNTDTKLPVLNCDQQLDDLWSTELERIFGFPVHYTDTGNLSASERQIVLGRSWSVQIIAHLLKFVQDLGNSQNTRYSIKKC
ncbi:hypothetical protein ILUMI_27559 [Ignelater luminosus]|uniref:DNA (cytosine-5-)-methyltransferase n=1 Tax=Ignelater luminosus TaxID=2038154 RepID=A0A8K0DIY6_IGNLU|nr:hypothetical protein ILUMI_27559 [Ignelater luminosus]